MLTGLGFCRTLLCGAFEVKCREKVFLRGPADESPTRKQKPAVLQCYTPNISLVRHNTVNHRPSHALDGGRHVAGCTRTCDSAPRSSCCAVDSPAPDCTTREDSVVITVAARAMCAKVPCTRAPC